ncbi:hypothetical protein E6C55_19415 [Cohnella fermenti]|uniref:FAD/NAD(P)-binding domain-containing protein n=1 Tax=Cohnella fermenti TaxID=2565925 RepID=A0A4S4BNL8_9BACL|nr:hypothetical protein E6C55_19415 [Cohnella fermenti]
MLHDLPTCRKPIFIWCSPSVCFKQLPCRFIEAKAVIDASGTWSSPNPAVSEGIWTENERKIQSKISYAIPDVSGKDRDRYAGKNVLVVGSGHSAINALLDLAKLQERIINKMTNRS